MAAKKSSGKNANASTGFWARFMVLAVVVLWVSLAAGSWAGRYLLTHDKKLAISANEFRPFPQQRTRFEGRPPVLPSASPGESELPPRPQESAAPTPDAAASPAVAPSHSTVPGTKSPSDVENPDVKRDEPPARTSMTHAATHPTTHAARTAPRPDVAPPPIVATPESRSAIEATPEAPSPKPAASIRAPAGGGDSHARPEATRTRLAPAPPAPTPERSSQSPARDRAVTPPRPTPAGNGSDG